MRSSPTPRGAAAADLAATPADAAPFAHFAVPLLDFSREYAEIGPELLEAVATVFASQRYVLGPQVGEFECAAAGFCNVPEAVGCGSGTDALWLAMAAAGVSAGDRVATTPFSFFATASAILRIGAVPVFADIDPATFNLSASEVAKVQEASSAPLKAILPVHLFGQPADWDAIEALQARYNCLLIEDAAQAFCASWKGRPVGSLGHAAAFSFYPTKNLSAAGEAGMVTTRDPAIGERVRMLRAHGMRKRYYHDEVGWNSRLDTLQAAVLLVKMRYISGWTSLRREIAAVYDTLFRGAGIVDAGPYPDHGVVLPQTIPGAVHVFHQYVIRVRRRNELRAFLSQQEIGSEIYYPLPLHQQQALRSLGYQPGAFPEAERAAAEVLALPIYPQLRLHEQRTVVAAIARFLG